MLAAPMSLPAGALSTSGSFTGGVVARVSSPTPSAGSFAMPGRVGSGMLSGPSYSSGSSSSMLGSSTRKLPPSECMLRHRAEQGRHPRQLLLVCPFTCPLMVCKMNAPSPIHFCAPGESFKRSSGLSFKPKVGVLGTYRAPSVDALLHACIHDHARLHPARKTWSPEPSVFATALATGRCP